VAVITQGLLLWPYFTFARLIAPYVSPGKGQEYRDPWGALILLLVCSSTVLTAGHCRGRSSPLRSGLALAALAIGLWGTLERFRSGWVIGVVREWAPAG
jgi:hypothetical protein